jgi:hypothetical protein
MGLAARSSPNGPAAAADDPDPKRLPRAGTAGPSWRAGRVRSGLATRPDVPRRFIYTAHHCKTMRIMKCAGQANDSAICPAGGEHGAEAANSKARREFGWQPIHPTGAAVFTAALG